MRIIRFSVIVFICAFSGMLSAQEFVDLGLSVKWSTVNMGTTEYKPYGWYWTWTDAMAITTTDGSRMPTKAEWNGWKVFRGKVPLTQNIFYYTDGRLTGSFTRTLYNKRR